MQFATLDFVLFFLLVAGLAALLRPWPRMRTWMLVAASYFFYGQWNWHFCFLLFLSSAISYAGGLALAPLQADRPRRLVVGVTVALHLLLLGFFKYFDFTLDMANSLAAALGRPGWAPGIEVILPVGISFFTFHGISYVVDVFRREVAVCRDPAQMLLYLAFFPQLISGPIVRAKQFLPQLYHPAPPPADLAVPMALILGGLFKKVVVAGHLASTLVDPVFNDPGGFGTVDLLAAAYGYAVQIYCDFSGYTDIAMGLAALLGYRFPDNFDQPYRAGSLQEFWRRWHITLSSWLRDYLYKPLGGSRGSRLFTGRNLMITMVLGGIWHGAQWKFVAWGALHGGVLLLERLLAPGGAWRRFPVLGTLVTFHVVCLGWILFRADSFETAWIFVSSLPGWGDSLQQLTPVALALIIASLLLQFAPRGLHLRAAERLAAWPGWAQGALAGAVLVAVDALAPDGVPPFIYFQF